VSDGLYLRDLTTDIIAREAEYTRSTATFFHRAEDRYAGLDVTLRQDLRTGYSFFGSNAAPTGSVLPEIMLPPRTFQRLPAVTFALPERSLLGSLTGSLHAQFTRLSPLLDNAGDEGLDGVQVPGTLVLPGSVLLRDAAQNGVFDALDREARDRIDVVPRIGTSFGLGSLARVSPSLAVRQDLYVGERTGRTGQRGYPLASLVVDSEVSRSFTTGGGELRHAMTPTVEMRYVPLSWGAVPGAGASGAGDGRCTSTGDATIGGRQAVAPTGAAAGQCYDEIDSAIPSVVRGESAHLLHANAELTQKLHYRTRGGRARELLRLDVGQGFDLSRHAPALRGSARAQEGSVLRDTYARLATGVGYFRTAGLVRADPIAARITQLSLGASLDNGTGEGLSLTYDQLIDTGSDALRRGIDTLVGVRVDPSLIQDRARTLDSRQLSVALRFDLPVGFRASYAATVQPQLTPISLVQHAVGLSFGPACDCWRVEGVAIQRRAFVGLDASEQPLYALLPDFSVNLSVSGFGSFGN